MGNATYPKGPRWHNNTEARNTNDGDEPYSKPLETASSPQTATAADTPSTSHSQAHTHKDQQLNTHTH